MAAMKLHVLKPSVNNLTVRIFVRAAGLDFEELDVWGQTTTPEFLAKDQPAEVRAAAIAGLAAKMDREERVHERETRTRRSVWTVSVLADGAFWLALGVLHHFYIGFRHRSNLIRRRSRRSSRSLTPRAG